jgi:hypothetical protein
MSPTHDAVLRAIEAAWSRQSSTKWHPETPAAGQCSVTALLLLEMLGGRLLKTGIGDAWHFYNEVDGARIDLTASQFAAPIHYDDLDTDRIEALRDTSDAQLAALRAAALARLSRT